MPDSPYPILYPPPGFTVKLGYKGYSFHPISPIKHGRPSKTPPPRPITNNHPKELYPTSHYLYGPSSLDPPAYLPFRRQWSNSDDLFRKDMAPPPIAKTYDTTSMRAPTPPRFLSAPSQVEGPKPPRAPPRPRPRVPPQRAKTDERHNRRSAIAPLKIPPLSQVSASTSHHNARPVEPAQTTETTKTTKQGDKQKPSQAERENTVINGQRRPSFPTSQTEESPKPPEQRSLASLQLLPRRDSEQLREAEMREPVDISDEHWLDAELELEELQVLESKREESKREEAKREKSKRSKMSRLWKSGLGRS